MNCVCQLCHRERVFDRTQRIQVETPSSVTRKAFVVMSYSLCYISWEKTCATHAFPFYMVESWIFIFYFIYLFIFILHPFLGIFFPFEISMFIPIDFLTKKKKNTIDDLEFVWYRIFIFLFFYYFKIFI